MEFRWVDGYEIKVSVCEDGSVLISANREGLLSLAGHFTALAEEKCGAHFHLDEYNSLEEGSAELVVELAESRRE